MKLELGRRADYAIRAAVDLARHEETGGRRKARAIAQAMAIPTSYLPQILAELVRARIATSVAGPDGGYALARAPAEVSLLEVLHAVDGALPSTSCVLRSGPCRWEDVCAVHVPLARAQQALLDVLDRTSLGDVVRIDAQLDAGTFTLPPEIAPPVSPPRVGA